MNQDSPFKRIALVVNALSGTELRAGKSDSARVYGVLVDPSCGACDPGSAVLVKDCPDRDDFSKNLLQVLKGWNIGDQLILYYSGHGEEMRGLYHLCFGGETKSYFPFKSILTELMSAGVSRAIVILDSCQSGAALRKGEKSSPQKSIVSADEIPRGLAIITSCRANENSYEKDDQSQSLFTGLFCDAITSGLSGSPTPNGKISVSDLVGWVNTTIDNDPKISGLGQTSTYGIDGGAEHPVWIALNKSGPTASMIDPHEPKYSEDDLAQPPMDFDKWLTRVTTFSADVLKSFREKLRPDVRESMLADNLDELAFLARANLLSNGRLYATGVLLFSEQPEKLIPGAYVQCFEFAGTDRSASQDQKEFYGPLMTQLEGAMNFIESRIEKVEITEQGALAARFEFQYPMVCIRELLANALCHRDYLDATRHTSVRVFQDRIEIVSPGNWVSKLIEVDKEMALGVLESESATRNERLATSLRRIRLVETGGSGIPSALSDCKERGAKAPTALCQDRTVRVSVYPRDNWSKASFGRRGGVLTTIHPSTTSASNNLPRLQSFFGRAEELKKIAAALVPKTRTWGVLIDGPGGIGKTSLAIRAAELAPADQFLHIFFLSSKERKLTAEGERKLSDFVTPSYLDMLNEMARLLKQPDLAKQPEAERTRLLIDALAPAQALLILDNLESMPKDQQNQLFEFLSQLPPGCKAIATSRLRTDVDARIIRLAKLDQDAALELIAELATDRPLLAKATAEERIHLYEETGGNPLLLRWIAGQLGRGRCRTIAGALDLLRNAAAENDPLEFILGDVLGTFTENETKVLSALTYFTQQVDVKLIAELANISRTAAETALGDLANRALVVPDEEEKLFALVPLVADFLRRKRPEVVAEAGNRLEQRAFAMIVENGYEKHDRFPVLDEAWPTVAPALPLFVAGLNGRLQTVCSALFQFFNFTGRWDESLSLNRQAETKAVAAGDYHNAGWRAYHAGWVYRVRLQADAVLTCADRAAAHWQTAQADARERATAIRLRGLGYRLKEDSSAAIAAYREALDLCRSLSAESDDVARLLNELANAESDAGDIAAAERDYREALRAARAVGYLEGVAYITGNLADLALDRENWLEAEPLAREALTLAEKLGRQELIAEDCQRLAEALVGQGKGNWALPHAQRAVEIYTRLGSPNLEAARETLQECEESSKPVKPQKTTSKPPAKRRKRTKS